MAQFAGIEKRRTIRESQVAEKGNIRIVEQIVDGNLRPVQAILEGKTILVRRKTRQAIFDFGKGVGQQEPHAKKSQRDRQQDGNQPRKNLLQGFSLHGLHFPLKNKVQDHRIRDPLNR